MEERPIVDREAGFQPAIKDDSLAHEMCEVHVKDEESGGVSPRQRQRVIVVPSGVVHRQWYPPKRQPAAGGGTLDGGPHASPL